MKKSATLSIAALGGQDGVQLGDLVLEKGRVAIGLRCYFQLTLNKSDAGTATLSAAQKNALLGHFSLTFKYGAKGRKPYDGVGFDRLRLLQRYLFGSELEGYSDSTNGLGKTIAASGDTTMAWTSVIPLGRVWQITGSRKVFGVGRTQARTIQFEIRRAAGQPSLGAATITIKAGVPVAIDIYPMDIHSKGDRWTYLPGWGEATSVKIEFTFADGLPLYAVERSAAHASTSLTEMTTKVDAEPIHEQVNPQRVLDEYHDESYLPAEADNSTEETLLYMLATDVGFEDLPSGKFFFRQPQKNLATMQLGLLRMPIIPEEEVRSDAENCAELRGKYVKLVSVAHTRGFANQVPKHLSAFMPFDVVDVDDAENEKFPGVGAPNGGKADVFVPKTLADATAAKVLEAKSKGDTKLANDLVSQLAAAVPGAAQSGRGVGVNTSTTTERIRKLVGG